MLRARPLRQPSPGQSPAPSTTDTARPCTELPLGAREKGSRGAAHLLVEDRLGLATEARLLPVVPPLTCESEGVGARHAARRALLGGKGRARHGTALVRRCVLHELRPRRRTAAAAGPSSSPTG